MTPYWRDAAVRVGSTFAGGVVAVVGVTGADLTEARTWIGGALAGAVSVLRLLAVAGKDRAKR